MRSWLCVLLVVSFVRVAYAQSGVCSDGPSGEPGRHCGCGVEISCSESCDDACGGSSGDGSSGGSSSNGGGGGQPPEIRLLGGARVFAFDAGIHTEKTMAGQTADAINANASVKPGLIITAQVDPRRWSGPLFDLTYFRNSLSSSGTDLGVMQGVTIMVGYERGIELGSRCGVQAQLAGGARLGYFSASEQNTEAEAEDLRSFYWTGALRLGLSCRLMSGVFVDLATGAFFSPTSYEAGNGDLLNPKDEVWIRTSSVGMIGGIGLTLAP
jgi:hypothetical protein